jgi:predicted nucleic acid-binding protein
MTPVFADTAHYLAVVSPQDQYHAAAVAWAARLRGRLVTTEFILVELGNSLIRGEDRDLFSNVLRLIRTDPRTTVEPVSSALLQRGIDLFARRPDKTWSLTDCTSFVIMTDRGLTDALTADQHFVQAGFRALLLGPPDAD